MISVGSRDERKEVSLRYGIGGGKMELETEIEEGEACFQNNNGDDSTIDPDISLSYIDEKIQDVLGDCQKDFEGGVSAENLGAKFGGYGSFLPTYQRSPLWPHPKTPPKVLSAPMSPNNAHVEVGHQNYGSQSASQPARHGPASFRAGSPAPRGPSMNGKLKLGNALSAMHGDKSALNAQQPVNNFVSDSDQKSLKVRIRVGSDNLSTRRNAEIYSGLGLDVSPSSSLEASPVDSDGFLHVPHDGADESPTSILEIMTSFPVCGSLLLSPLPYDVLNLTEKEKGSQESSVTALHGSDLGKVDQNVVGEKPKSSETNTVSMESTNGNNVHNGTGILAKKETSMDNLGCEELVSNSRRLPLPSNAQCNTLEFGQDAAFGLEPDDDLSNIAKDDRRVEQLNGDGGSVGKIWEANNTTCDENNSVFPTKADSDVSSGSKTLDGGLVKPPKQKDAQKAPSHEKDIMKSAPGNKTSSSGGKRKSKGQVLDLKNNSFTSKNKNNAYGSKSYTEDLKKNRGKARETYKDFFGDLDLEQEDQDEMALEKPSGGRLKDSVVSEKGTLENNSLSKERLIGKKSQKPSSSLNSRVGSHVPTMGNGLVSDAAVATVAPVVNEDWVCCDKCEKWRLLPPGLNPGSLPEKWLCSMLDWLPGMNRCSISEEETTKAITSHFPGPSLVQGSQPVHPGGPQSGVFTLDASYPDGRHQHFGSEIPSAGVKKKHANEAKQDRPSLSSNSAKNLHTSYRSRSLNGINQSPRIDEAEFQDSGQSNDMIAEKDRSKKKESNKLCDNFVDEGDNTHHSKISNKRESTQDFRRDCKKVKTDGNHGTDEDWTSDHGGTVFKASCSSSSGLPAGISRKDRGKLDHRPKVTKSASKVSAQDPENQNQTSSNDRTFHLGTSNKRDAAKKRKANEFEGVKERKVLKSGDEGICANKGVEGADRRGKKVEDSSRRDTVPLVSSMAATSSSSKVSGSHKIKANNQGAKGSPVESVSSSPLRILNTDKFTSSRKNIRGIDDLPSNKDKEKIVPFLEFETCHVAGGNRGAETSSHGHNEERTKGNQSHSNGSRSRKHGKGSSLRSKDKSRSRSDIDEDTPQTSEPLNKNLDIRPYEERTKGGRKVDSDKFANGSKELPLSESAKTYGQSKHRHHDGSDVRIDAISSQDLKQPSKKDVSGRGKSHSLPSSGKGKKEIERRPQPIPGYRKENAGNTMSLDAARRNDSSKASKQNKKAQHKNGNQSMNTKHSTPNRHKGRDEDAPIYVVRDMSNQATTNALREATNLKHMADRMKNSGSSLESRALYMQAALKFLHVASLFESCHSQTGRYGDMIQSTSIYSSTAKLCEYCAHEYERTKEMAIASLAYKCMEVAYLKVIYSSHTTACKDLNELQTSLQIGPTGESPSSSASASDLDNMNNPATVDKAALAKGVTAPQVAGNHVIAARNKPNFMRILNFAQDVNSAMEAARKSQIAFAASSSKEEAGLSAVKKALDFHFHDVEELLRLVRVAMEVINR